MDKKNLPQSNSNPLWNKNIGLVIMFRLDQGGGAPRLIVDLIKDLNALGCNVFLFNPFKIDFKKIEEMYGPIKIEKVYNAGRFKRFFCKNSILGRKIMKKEFQKMANDVNLIMDVDGGIVHNYLPKNFDESKYIIWRFAAIETKSADNLKSKRPLKRIIKDLIKKILNLEQTKTRNSLSRTHKIYPIDDWIKKSLIEKWGLAPEEQLPHSIHTEEYSYKGEKKKNQIAILVRLAPNKMVDHSIKVFAFGTKKHKNYKLLIFGGVTSDSKKYLKYLKELIKGLGIQDRVSIIKNPSSVLCKQFLLESKLLLDSQDDIPLAMGPVEAMAAGCIVLTRKNNGTYKETLMNGKFGFGFDGVKEGGEKLEKILNGLEKGTLDNKQSIKRSNFCSEKNFIGRLKEVIEQHT